MATYALRRIASAIPVALLVSVIAFFLMQLTPGDPATFFVSPDATPEEIERVRERLGVDRPIMVQFASWLSRIVQGDLGVSFFYKRPVLSVVLDSMPVSLWLTGLSLSIGAVLGVSIGVFSATRPGSALDKAATIFVFAGISMPNFWLAMLLVLVLSLGLGLFPVQGFNDTSLLSILHSLALPSMVLGYSLAAIVARMTRSSVLEVLHMDYVRTARAKGTRARVVLGKHVLLNAFNPVLTVIGLGAASLISGAVVVETVFNLPGIGSLTVDSINRRDYPLIQGVLLFAAVLVIGVNLITDLLYGVLDPRVRYERASKDRRG